MRIIEAKQVGNISYFVTNYQDILTILEDQSIRMSKVPEHNPNTDKRQYFVSFARDLFRLTSRPKYNYGIILDGDKLSNKYSFSPYSYVNHAAVGINPRKLRILYILKYSNRTYAANFKGWGTIGISEEVYNKLENILLNMTDEKKRKSSLTELEPATRSTHGRRRIGGYKLNALGSDPIDYNALGEDIFKISTKDEYNETKERIWSNSREYVDIKGCIKAIAIPKKQKNDDSIKFFTDYLTNNNYSIIYY